MIEFTALYSDGESSDQQQATVMINDGWLVVRGITVGVSAKIEDLQISDRLGNTARFILLPNGGKCETTDNDQVDQMLKDAQLGQLGHMIHTLEKHWQYALIAILVVAITIAGIIRYGVPLAAEKVAFGLPGSVEQNLGVKILSMMDKTWFTPSELDEETRKKVRSKFTLVATGTNLDGLRLEFRKGNAVGANAFALPAGTIVITDELINMTNDYQEILGILDHEAGHIAHRHALRSYLQNSMIAMTLVVITGDISSLVAGIPTLLIKSKYSRDFEREADRFAANLLTRQGVKVSLLADFLTRLTEGKENSKMLPYISTHPPTTERVHNLMAEGHK